MSRLKLGLWTLAARWMPPSGKRVARRLLAARWFPISPPIRRFTLRLPAPPISAGPAARTDSAPQSLRIEAGADVHVARLLETGGVAAYEPETMAAFLAAITFKQAAVAFDVGANVGVYSLVGGATTSAHIVGFEPTPDLARTFRAIAQANALSCTVEPIALGARTGRATLYLSASTDSSNSLDAGFRRAIGTVEVPLERLDDYVARTGLVPAVMKIDTESTEPDVLAGGSELLRVHRPWIVCEVLAGLTETGLEEVLRPLGYHFNQLGPGLPKPASAIVGDPTYLNRDWLFTPEPISADYQVHFAAWRSAIAAI